LMAPSSGVDLKLWSLTCEYLVTFFGRNSIVLTFSPPFSFFERVDRALRRSVGVSETAKTEVVVEPAPPQASSPPIDPEEVVMNPNDFVDFKDFRESLKQKAGEEQKPLKSEMKEAEE